ncbi:MAG TPA: hypothetical protein VG674_16115 [Amycolatopsis sp.]|jgi:hypothetical protein|nr:hypothetical protein [Amycolatopsis sp.]
MRDTDTGLHPAADLVPEGDTEQQEQMRRRAARAVAANARDAADCALLLDMLGLHSPRSGRRGEVA